MPSRVIRGEINASRSLARVSLVADLTFRALLVSVDDYGRCEADPLMLKAELFPRRTDVTPALVRQWVDELCREGCARLYVAEGVEFLQLMGWEKHRSNGKRAERSKFPPPNDGDQEPRAAEAGVVYFIQSGSNGPIKIGWTTCPEQRFDVLRTMVPGFQLLGVMDAESSAAEKRLHRTYKALRSDGEWFRPDPALLEFIAGNAKPWTARDGPKLPAAARPSDVCRLTSDEGRVASDESRAERPAEDGLPSADRMPESAEGESAPELEPDPPLQSDPPAARTSGRRSASLPLDPPVRAPEAAARDSPLLNLLVRYEGEPEEKRLWLDHELPVMELESAEHGKSLKQLTVRWYRAYLGRPDRRWREEAKQRKRAEERRALRERLGIPLDAKHEPEDWDQPPEGVH